MSQPGLVFSALTQIPASIRVGPRIDHLLHISRSVPFGIHLGSIWGLFLNFWTRPGPPCLNLGWMAHGKALPGWAWLGKSRRIPEQMNPPSWCLCHGAGYIQHLYTHHLSTVAELYHHMVISVYQYNRKMCVYIYICIHTLQIYTHYMYNIYIYT